MSLYTPTTHATVSSAITQTVVATTVAYPVLFESDDDILGIGRDGGTVSLNSNASVTVTCVAPATTILSTGTPIKFTVLSDETKGIALNTIYYVSNIAGGAGSFKLSSTIALARAGTSDIGTTGAITGTFESVSRLYFKEPGDYELIISAVVDSTGITGSTPQTLDLWLVKGNSTSDLVGTNMANTDTQCSTDRTGVQLVLAVSFIIDVVAGNFIRLDYRGSDTRLRLLAIAAVSASGSTPAIPACPSIIIAVKKIGA